MDLQQKYKKLCVEIGSESESHETVSSLTTQMDCWTVVLAGFIFTAAKVDSGQDEELK
jgi:hypothetical protein